MKKILITGGAGFVGSNLAILLKQELLDIDVIAVDNLKRRGSELNLKRLNYHGVNFIHGDIRNKEDLESINSFDLLIDCSAEPSVTAGYGKSPEYLLNTNLIGTINCLEVVRKCNAAFLFLSTSRVYPIKSLNSLKLNETATRFALNKDQTLQGVSNEGISESFPLDKPRSLYGTSKLASEMLIQEYSDMYGIKSVINRCGVLTGPWQMGKIDQGVVVLWIARHIFGGKLNYIGFGGKGFQVRDILHINDLYELVKIQLRDVQNWKGNIYNIGGGNELSVSLKELTELCKSITGNKLTVNQSKSERNADIPYYVTNYRKIREETNWKPTLDIEKIMQDIVDWINENYNDLKLILS